MQAATAFETEGIHIDNSFIDELVRRLSGQRFTYSPALGFIADFLQVVPEDVITVKIAGRAGQHLIMAAAIKRLFEDDNAYRLMNSADFNEFSGTVDAPTVRDVQVGPDEHIECYTQATMCFVEVATGKKFVIQISVEGAIPVIAIAAVRGELEFASDMAEKIRDWMARHNFLKGQILEAIPDVVVRLSSRPCNATWEDIILPADLIAEVKRNVLIPILKSNVLRRHGIARKRGIILEGAPGVGKTLLGEVLANELRGKATFIWVTGRSITYTSDFAEIYAAARNLAPTVVWIEDLDLIAQSRDLGGNTRLLGEIMNELDVASDEPLVTIATTNCPEIIETAVRDRPSRFDRCIKFPLPDADARLAMIMKFTASTPVADSVDIDRLVDATEDFTGAQIKELITTAALLAVERDPKAMMLTVGDIEKALEYLAVRRKQLGFTA